MAVLPLPPRVVAVSVVLGMLGVALAALPADGSQRLAGRLARAEKRESEMVRVPAGAFQIGADAEELADFQRACEDEFGPDVGPAACRPERSKDFATGAAPRLVFVSDFDIDRFEVTTAQYRECVAHGPCDMRPLVAGDSRYAVDAWPMVNVTWDDASTYCAWRGKRLPTEAEWEKAARGVDGRPWPWGKAVPTHRANLGRLDDLVERPASGLPSTAVDDADGFRELAPPGSLPFGRSPYGAQDMAGNAAEWVSDWYDENGYANQTTVDPSGPKSGYQKVTRGGSFFEPRFFARTYYRNAELPTERSITRGMRCARSVAP